MSVVPNKQLERLQFYENHIAAFTTNAVAIGSSDAEIATLDTQTQAARNAYDAQQLAMQSAKVATETFQNALENMTITGAGVMKKIRGQAETTRDPNVYTMAQIPAPADPTPVAVPGTPRELEVKLNGDGSLMLKWKCDNPARATGTTYQVYRSEGGSLDFIYLGGAGTRAYIDTTIPAGATRVTYKIQAVRSTSVGMWATFNVLFGSNAGGIMTAQVTEESASKMAA